MQISSFSNFNSYPARKTPFKGKKEDIEELSRKYEAEKNTKGLLMFVATAIAVGVGMYNTGKDMKKDDPVNKVMELYDSTEIKKDTFQMKDLNRDEVPEILLQKKDGTIVAYDLFQNEILN